MNISLPLLLLASVTALFPQSGNTITSRDHSNHRLPSSRVMSSTQFGSHDFPPSTEYACSPCTEFVRMPDKTNRTRAHLPEYLSKA